MKNFKQNKIRVVELFAGVGGFRLGLEGKSGKLYDSPYEIVWANQWEPPGTASRQFAFRCYEQRFSDEIDADVDSYASNEDIAAVLDKVETGDFKLPKCDLLVGGFPCQDYSVARPLAHSDGLDGKKGVLWWQIHRFLKLSGENKPKYLLLENVDRMLKSPASQRGRDFAIMLSALAGLGYSVEWRVINAADYGFPQKRTRVFIFAELTDEEWCFESRILHDGVLASALPVTGDSSDISLFAIDQDPVYVSEHFGKGAMKSPFLNAGVMQGYAVQTVKTTPNYCGEYAILRDVLVDEDSVPENFFIAESALERWRYGKASKREKRINKKTGHEYYYAEGAMQFPDALDRPARTILTSEGGAAPSRSKHIIQCDSGRYRRLIPDELDVLSGFPRGWTNTGMSDAQRAFCVGNALVVGIVTRIGKALAQYDAAIRR